jgi:hypothetical protein
MSEYSCDSCGTPLSKSGYYSARKRGYCRQCKPSTGSGVRPQESASSFGRPSSPDPDPTYSTMTGYDGEPSEETEPIPVEESSGPSWMDFDLGDEPATESIPSALKMAAGLSGGEGTPNVQMMHETNLSILKMGLSGVDVLLTQYGRAVMIDPEYECRHADSDKEIVARAQYQWMLEKGINPADYVSSGGVAAALTSYYILPPLVKIQRKSKRKMFKNLGGITKPFKRIWPFGRKRRAQEAVKEGQDGNR